ncbi:MULTISPECIES: ABC transporter ATP-binding protein [unclassified Rhodococcus (in: high G+C Gram-positive bacteria)]|uniref:ABC transporter ATP-binding protein n=1 Tax=unclassified Rhodococcus (in: high G+C Gram-positive bacteria) TaxID=192944 RepID=UPI000E0BF0E3|nr:MULTISPECIES: ABC transporter ATP-binding protein [unclassified Rhodococcus (in: high G+C Gram-positive bacteria)]QKT09493.1 ABC transporter ATP-binding protein [Rhodococcus sp. W8901]RDI16475.1 peptide/nickel transport system ATP-binding protein [Rhodococcus sp. AG1013]
MSIDVAGRLTSTHADAEPVLRVEGLSVDFVTDRGWTRVVDGVDLSVPAGSVVGVVGESGSGKTVTSLAAMGLLPAATSKVSGSIRVAGRELVGMTDRELADVRGTEVSMIFQEPRRSLDPAFSVGSQIAEVVRRHERVGRKAAWARAVEMLDAVGIDDAARRADAYPHEFSGGMCQRVMLAIAMVCRPKLLIADEPTTALDVTVQAQMLDLMREVQQQFEVAILFITHDLGVVAQMCDAVNVMYAGQVIESAPVEDLFLSPQHPYAQGLLDAIPDHRDRSAPLQAIAGAVPAPWDWPDSCRFAPRCPHAGPECEAGPVPLAGAAAESTRAVRCVRANDLVLEGITG